MHNHLTEITNILVIGSGGAGLRAAIEAKLAGLDVKVIGKRNKYDVHTGLAAGGVNAAFGNLDKEDSWEQHFADTYLEGYGIGDPRSIEIMAKEATQVVEEIDKWGANFEKIESGMFDQRFFGAHTYRRTCYSGDFTGQSILNALLKKSKELNIPIYDFTYVTDLLVHQKCCFGAMTFNINNGERTVYIADAVIICTGGHTRIWKKSSSRKQENTGDGYHLALKAGCTLIDMEMVQFHPTGMVLPEDIAGTLVTEAVRGEGGRLINGVGERFMKNYDIYRMELSTRDRVAIANYTEIIEGRSSPNGGVFLDISHKDKEFIINKIPKIYRQFIDSQSIDISKQPMEVAPTAHYSMGGILVKADDHSTEILGLYAAGEAAGGLHGANRLGGNSLAEILIFGKNSGKAASDYSKKLTSSFRCRKAIKLAHENINAIISKGEELVIPLQRELSEIMWKYCGVVKNKEQLMNGLSKLRVLEKRSFNIDVRINDRNYQDLINTLDFKSSLVTAEATIISSIAREESRGAHQRSDYPELKKSENHNYAVKFKNFNNLSVFKEQLKYLREDLKLIIGSTNKITSFEGKLLE